MKYYSHFLAKSRQKAKLFVERWQDKCQGLIFSVGDDNGEIYNYLTS